MPDKKGRGDVDKRQEENGPLLVSQWRYSSYLQLPVQDYSFIPFNILSRAADILNEHSLIELTLLPVQCYQLPFSPSPSKMSREIPPSPSLHF